jgi:hypothetical protein
VTYPDHSRRFRPGDTLSFDLLLMGRAVDMLRHVVLAVELMSKRGLGANRASFELKEARALGAQASRLQDVGAGASRLQDVGAGASRLLGGDAEGSGPRGLSLSLGQLIRERLSELTREKEPTDELHDAVSLAGAIAEALTQSLVYQRSSSAIPVNPVNSGSLKVRFLTPARIRVNGDLQTEISFELLVRNLLRRVSMLAAVHGSGPMDLDYRGLIDRANSVATLKSGLRWWDLERYTDRQYVDPQYPDRQGGKLKIGGLIGEAEYDGEAIAEFLPLLVAGELLRIGTGTSFGLGRYEVIMSSNC